MLTQLCSAPPTTQGAARKTPTQPQPNQPTNPTYPVNEQYTTQQQPSEHIIQPGIQLFQTATQFY